LANAERTYKKKCKNEPFCLFFYLIFLFLFHSFLVNNISAQELKIALMQFRNDSPYKEWERYCMTIPEIISTRLLHKEVIVGTTTRRITIVDRSHIEQILKELKLPLSGVVDEATARQIGKMVGANAIVTGVIALIGKKIIIIMKLIEVETAELLASKSGECVSEDEIIEVVKNLTSNMFVLPQPTPRQPNEVQPTKTPLPPAQATPTQPAEAQLTKTQPTKAPPTQSPAEKQPITQPKKTSEKDKSSLEATIKTCCIFGGCLAPLYLFIKHKTLGKRGEK